MARTTTRTTQRDAHVSMWAALESWECTTCGGPMPFEPVPCLDGHDEDCPDRICIGCGVVVVVGPAPAIHRRSA